MRTAVPVGYSKTVYQAYPSNYSPCSRLVMQLATTASSTEKELVLQVTGMQARHIGGVKAARTGRELGDSTNDLPIQRNSATNSPQGGCNAPAHPHEAQGVAGARSLLIGQAGNGPDAQP